MLESLNHIRNKSFYKLLFSKTVFPVINVIGIGLLYIIFMSTINHHSFPFPYIILIFALVKTIVIALTTLKQLSKLIKVCDSLERLLWVFGILISLTIFSFATDYACIYQFDHFSFEGFSSNSENYFFNLFHFFYFSVITFSTVGYGDITPVSEIAKFVVLLEIFLSFFIIVFSLANIKKIHINE